MINLTMIVGPCLLLIGCLIIIGSVTVSLFKDRKSKNPRQHPNWIARVKKESEFVSWVLIIVGSALAGTAFIPSPLSYLGIASLCIIALGEIVLILGLIWHFKQQHTSDASESSSSTPFVGWFFRLFPSDNFYETLGWGMAFPGICLSCVGWARYNREIAGITGVVMLTIGCVSMAIAAIKKWRGGAKRAAIFTLSWLFSVCGIIMSPVGFKHRPVGEPLGIAGACLLGMAFLGHVMLRFTRTNTISAPARNAQQDDDLPSYQVACEMPAPPPPAESNMAGSHSATVSDGSHANP